jgi:hypothetical protein
MLIHLLHKTDKYVVLVHFAILITFSFIYHYNSNLFIGHVNGDSDYEVKNKGQVIDNLSDNKYINSLYFSAIVHTTTGFGRIYPINIKAKIIVLVHLLTVFATILTL